MGKDLKVKRLACVKCPMIDAYQLIKHCVSCCYFKGNFRIEEYKNEITCDFVV